MKQASDYPISFPYGATSAPYGTAALPYHRGDDRAMPNGTPVIVNGVQIGLSNNTGFSTGSHLHLGRFQGGKDTNPNGQGFNLKAPVMVTTVASDATNGKYVRLTDGDGVQWVYLHLQSQSVTQGQELKGGSPQGDDMLTLDDRYKLWRMARLVDPNPDEVRGWEKMDDATFVANLWNNGGYQFKQKADAIKINDIRADFLKQIGQAVGLDPDKDGLEPIVNKVKELKK
jgi:hypothetical protein